MQVKIGLTLQQILNIDIEESSMTGIYWVNIEWVDDYLAWSEDDEAQVRWYCHCLLGPMHSCFFPKIVLFTLALGL